MNRREFIGAALLLAAAPASAGGRRSPLALVTADRQAHVVAVRLGTGRIVRRIATGEGPRSIEQRGRGPAVVGHALEGLVTLIDPGELRVRRVLRGFSEPRYAAIDGERAYVTDSGTGELAVIDLVRGRVVRRIEVGAGARHLGISPDGRRLWVSLGSSAAELVVVDLDGPQPHVKRRIRPPFLAHDVAFSPSGRRVWVTAGRERRLAIYAAGGWRPLRELGADAAPQHITFGPYFAYVASGNGRTVRMHALADDGVRRVTDVSLGSFNIQRGGGLVVTPSLGDGALTVLDRHGRVRRRIDVADVAHDACVVT